MSAPYATRGQVVLRYVFWAYCGLVFFFLMAPILAIVPLSFNAGSFLTFPLPGLSLRWYADFFASDRWLAAVKNSMIVGIATTLLATTLGTAASLGLMRLRPRLRNALGAVIIAPIIVPVVITGVGAYFLYAPLQLTNSYLALVLAHTVIAVPFVVLTVSASLQNFDVNLVRAAASLGAAPLTAFRRVVLPLILPGVVSGAVFAFATSFDEVVMALFLAGPSQRTLPIQMFNGVREEISPTITAAATLLIAVSLVLLFVVEMLRRRAERYRRHAG
jgi:putative spermidine/putrescine transport system permease protein